MHAADEAARQSGLAEPLGHSKMPLLPSHQWPCGQGLHVSAVPAQLLSRPSAGHLSEKPPVP